MKVLLKYIEILIRILLFKLLKPLLNFIVTGLCGFWLLTVLTGKPVEEILSDGNVMAVWIVAIPTLVVWINELESKKLENDSTKIDIFLNLQENLEEKYGGVVNNYDDIYYESNQVNSDFKIQQNKLLTEVDKFVSYLMNSTYRIAQFDYHFYGIDLFRLYNMLTRIDDTYGNEMRSVLLKEKIISYIFESFEGDDLSTQTQFFGELRIFQHIDFSKMKNLNKGRMDGTPELIFESCTIDLDNFDYFLSSNATLEFKNCTFVSSSILFCSKEIKKVELENKYGFSIVTE